jgi:hypothetical protein
MRDLKSNDIVGNLKFDTLRTMITNLYKDLTYIHFLKKINYEQ